MLDINLILPWPPTVNSYYQHSPRGTFLSKKGRVFRDLVHQAIVEHGFIEVVTDPILVEVELYPPDRRKRDLDNYMKALLDAVTTAGLWLDDSLIDQLFIYRGKPISKGLVKLSISPAGPIIPGK